MLGRMKDNALSIALKKYLNDRFADYGEVLDCDVDTKKNRLTLHAQLRGELQPLTASVERYELERDDASMHIVLLSFSSSREWVTRLLTRLFGGKRYRVPKTVAALL